MKHLVAKIHPADNVLVALADLPIGTPVTWEGVTVTTTEKIPAKHKLALQPLAVSDEATMYGVLVGRMAAPVPIGGQHQARYQLVLKGTAPHFRGSAGVAVRSLTINI